jgi:hypothetical protein
MENEPCAIPGTRNYRTDMQQMGGMEDSQTSLSKCDSTVGTLHKKQLKNLVRREEAERHKDHSMSMRKTINIAKRIIQLCEINSGLC